MTTASELKRLYKSRTSRMIDGVCGGIAEYLNLDPTLVRIVWVLLTLMGGSGIILYILAMIIMPVNPTPSSATPSVASLNNHRFWGILLMVVGILWLMANLGLSFWHVWWGWSWDIVLAVVLILAGVAFLFGGRRYVTTASDGHSAQSQDGASLSSTPESTSGRKLYRSRHERKLFGVCGGLGNHFGVDPTIVRILLIIAAIASCGFVVLAYIILAIVVPEEPLSAQAV